jgi:hypothetical protein
MIRLSKGVRVIWIIPAVLTLIAALAGIMSPSIYDEWVAEQYIYGTIAQDVVAFILGIILLFISIRMEKDDWKLQAVGLGILSFLFYAYGVYVIELIYNWFYFCYMAIFSTSFFGILYSLYRIDMDTISRVVVKPSIRKLSIGFTILIPAIFIPLWTIMQAGLISSGEKIENTYGIFIMDLCFIMPLFVGTAILCWKKKAFGLVMAPSLFVLGFTLLFPVGLSSIVKWIININTEKLDIGSFIFYDGLALLFLIIGIVYLRSTQFSFPKVNKAGKTVIES